MKQYTNLMQMVEDFRTLPQNTNFEEMLKKDFSVEVEPDTEQYYKEYLWKYLVQSVVLGVPADQRYQYASKKLERFVADYPHVTQKYTTDDTVVPAVQKRAPKSSSKVVYADGEIMWHEKKGIFQGFYKGEIIARSKCGAEKVAEMMKAKGVTPIMPK